LYNVTYQLTPRTSTVLPSTAAAAAAAAAAAVVVVVFGVFFVVVFRFWVAALAC
jgi:preprotein translocase subunit SecF